MQLQQGGSASGDQFGEFLVQDLGLLADRLELDDQLDGEPTAGLAGQVPRPDRGDQRAGLPRTGTSWPRRAAAPGSSRCSRLLTWVRARPSSSRRSASMPITTRSSSTRIWTRPGARRAASATECAPDRVGLAAVAGGEHPHLRGQLRRHVKDDLAVMDQAVRQMPADAVAALHRPDPVRELTRRGEHLGVSRRVRAVLPRRQHPGLLIDDLDRGRALVRVHPRWSRLPVSSSASPESSGEAGTATSSWANPFRATPRTVPGEKQAM